MVFFVGVCCDVFDIFECFELCWCEVGYEVDVFCFEGLYLGVGVCVVYVLDCVDFGSVVLEIFVCFEDDGLVG